VEGGSVIDDSSQAHEVPLDLAMLRDVALGLVSLTENPAPTDSLVVPLGLSLWMRRHDASLSDMTAGMLSLRAAIVEAAGLDGATEPVPLPVSDRRVMVLNLAAYLADLVTRAARASGDSRLDVTGMALARIAG
jgi:hypothetical protein